MAELLARCPSLLIVQVHRSFAVNVNRVSEIRHRENGRDWQLKLEPPVNRLIPIGRTYLKGVWTAYGE